MQDTVKILGAAAGGYILGRTKKGKTAIALALWLSGKGRPADYARDQAMKLLTTDKGQELIGQLRGPLLTAGRKAALSAFEGQAGRLTDGLTRRTEMLSGAVDETGGKLGEAGRDTAQRLTSRRRRAAGPDEQPQDEYDEGLDDEYAEDEESAEEYTDEGDDYDDEDEGDLEEDEEPEDDDLEYSDYDDEPVDEDEEPRPVRGRRRSARAVRETA